MKTLKKAPLFASMRTAFSLLELLAVIAILSILMSAGMVAFQGGGGRAAAISTDSTKVFSAIAEARQLAISANTRTRFIFFTDAPDNPKEWWLRRYAILREVKEEIPYFEMAYAPWNLSPGLCFQRGTGYGDGIFAMESRASGAMPGAVTAEYAYIEFLPSGATAGASAATIFQIGREAVTASDTEQYALIGVSRQTGRVRMERK